MKQDRIEELLEKQFSKREPDGMRERVLSRAEQELRPPKSRVLRGLELGLACTVAAVILSANISDSARRTRLASGHPEASQLSARTAVAILEQQRIAYEEFAFPDYRYDQQRDRKGL